MHVRPKLNEQPPVGPLRFAARATIVFVTVLTLSTTFVSQILVPIDLANGNVATSLADDDPAPQPPAMPLTF